MPKFRKKPVVIEAEQYVPGGQSLIESWMIGHDARDQFGVAYDKIQIGTLGGVITADPYDWIVRGTAGEFYPVKPEIFNDIYEPEED